MSYAVVVARPFYSPLRIVVFVLLPTFGARQLKALPNAGMQEMSTLILACFLNTIILAFKQYPNDLVKRLLRDAVLVW